jgi:hypothetical protein
VPQVRKGKPDLKENRGLKDLKENRGLKDLKENWDHRVIPGFKENKARKVRW